MGGIWARYEDKAIYVLLQGKYNIVKMKKKVLTVGIPVSENTKIEIKQKHFRISTCTLQNSIRIDFSAPLPEVCSKLVKALRL